MPAPASDGTRDLAPVWSTASPGLHPRCSRRPSSDLHCLILQVTEGYGPHLRRPGGGGWGTVGASSSSASHLLRRIRSRCASRPDEVAWADSCGDGSLHHLAQTARFGGEATGLWDWLALAVAAALLGADPTAAVAPNSWGETPLHVFASHCGIGSPSCKEEEGEGMEESSSSSSSSSSWSWSSSSTGQGGSAAAAGILGGLLVSVNGSGSGLASGGGTAAGGAVTLRSAASRDCRGSLPLHLASALEEGPAGSEPQAPWASERQVLVVGRLIEAHPRALFAVDGKGRTPLHRAVESDRTGPGVVAQLLEAAEKHAAEAGAGTRDADVRRLVRGIATGGGSLLDGGDLLVVGTGAGAGAGGTGSKGSPPRIASPLHSLMNYWRCGGGGGGTDGEDPLATIARVGPQHWAKTVLILSAAYHGRARPEAGGAGAGAGAGVGVGGGLLHAAVGLACPPRLVRLLARLRPSELLEADRRGRVPLHLACLRGPDPPEPGGRGDGGAAAAAAAAADDDDDDDEGLVGLLIRQGEGAAACRLPDAAGRIPLHAACLAGHPWGRSLAPLFWAHPTALALSDPATGLRPFMLAAAAPLTPSGGRGGGDLDRLTAIYELLRRDPAAIGAARS